jgi:hypothetical protein
MNYSEAKEIIKNTKAINYEYALAVVAWWEANTRNTLTVVNCKKHNNKECNHCRKYQDEIVLPDENGNCSLCGGNINKYGDCEGQ